MTIKQLSTKLRHVADTLDELIGIERAFNTNESPKTAKRIIATLEKRKYKKRKQYTYKGKHWTQQPKNRARVIKMAKRRAAIRKEAA